MKMFLDVLLEQNPREFGKTAPGSGAYDDVGKVFDCGCRVSKIFIALKWLEQIKFCVVSCCPDHDPASNVDGFVTFGKENNTVYYWLPKDSPILTLATNLGRKRFWPKHGYLEEAGWELHPIDIGDISRFINE